MPLCSPCHGPWLPDVGRQLILSHAVKQLQGLCESFEPMGWRVQSPRNTWEIQGQWKWENECFFFLERYGNNQPWLIFLGSLFNSKWRSVKVFPGIERPIVRIPKTVLVVSSCWPSWFISRVFFVGFMADILNNSWGLQTNKPTSMTGGVPPCSHGIILGIYVA